MAIKKVATDADTLKNDADSEAKTRQIGHEVHCKRFLSGDAGVTNGICTPLEEERVNGFHMKSELCKANCLSVVVLLGMRQLKHWNRVQGQTKW